MFPKWCLGFLYLVAFLVDPIASKQVFFRLVSKEDDVKVEDERVPFLTKSFFTCSTKANCAEVAKVSGKDQFKEKTANETIGEGRVVYKKIKHTETEGKNI